MPIEDRDSFLVRAEVQRRQARAAEERLAREARREAAQQAQAAREPDDQQSTNDAPGLFNWLRRFAE